MALRRGTLERIGGLQALVTHLADDNALGRKVRNLGLSIGLAHTVPATTVPEARLADLFRHELRWARTIRALVPIAFAVSVLQFPLVWVALAILLSAGAGWAFFLFAVAWVVRAAVSRGIERALAPLLPGLAFRTSFWLLPLREVMSVAVMMIASYGGPGVDWRGHRMRAGAAMDLLRPLTPVSPRFVASRPMSSAPVSPEPVAPASGPRR